MIACAGGLDLAGPAGGGTCGSMGGGAGLLCCAYEIDPSSNVTQTKMRERFMDGKPGKSSRVIENQDRNLHSQVAFGQN